jgi:hypothetical protein
MRSTLLTALVVAPVTVALVAVPAVKVPTVTTITVVHLTGKTPGKVELVVFPKPTTGPHNLTSGTCTISIDGKASVTVPITRIGHCHLTAHVAPGQHKVVAHFNGTAADAPSTGSMTFTEK